MGGFSLFGTSGDRNTSQVTTNVTNDTTTTTANSNNIANTNNLNAALTKNSSFIKNDSNVQNTALQLTDSFNRFQTYNLANVGNTTIGAPAAPGVSDYTAFFNATQPKPTVTPVDLSKPMLDFNTLSNLNVGQLQALAGLSSSVQTGFAANTSATGQTLANAITASQPGAAALSTTWKIVLAGAAIVIVFLLVKRR